MDKVAIVDEKQKHQVSCPVKCLMKQNAIDTTILPSIFSLRKALEKTDFSHIVILGADDIRQTLRLLRFLKTQNPNLFIFFYSENKSYRSFAEKDEGVDRVLESPIHIDDNQCVFDEKSQLEKVAS